MELASDTTGAQQETPNVSWALASHAVTPPRPPVSYEVNCPLEALEPSKSPKSTIVTTSITDWTNVSANYFLQFATGQLPR